MRLIRDCCLLVMSVRALTAMRNSSASLTDTRPGCRLPSSASTTMPRLMADFLIAVALGATSPASQISSSIDGMVDISTSLDISPSARACLYRLSTFFFWMFMRLTSA